MKTIHFVKGDRVSVVPIGTALSKSLPASKWLKKRTIVTMLDDGANHGLDVYDVLTPSGAEESVYGFQVVRKLAKRRR